MSNWVRQARVLIATGLVIALYGCSLDEVTIPDIDGPSELGTSVTLTVSPDVLVADGFSTASVQATVRNQNGQLVQGRQIFFTIASAEGILADIGSLNSTTAFTGNNGVAQVIYKAPPRTDATVNQSVLIAARPVTDDLNGAIYRQARIELRSAEPILFPTHPDNQPPICSFVMEPSVGPEPGGAYKVGTNILFQSTARNPPNDVPTDSIVRYEWDFGDGTRPDDRYFPQANHTYAFPGTFTVSHVCTDRFGGQGLGFANLVLVP